MLINYSIKVQLSLVCWFLLVNFCYSENTKIPNCLDLISHCNVQIQHSENLNLTYSIEVNATEALKVGGNNICERVIHSAFSSCVNYDNGTCVDPRLNQYSLTCGLAFYKLKSWYASRVLRKHNLKIKRIFVCKLFIFLNDSRGICLRKNAAALTQRRKLRKKEKKALLMKRPACVT